MVTKSITMSNIVKAEKLRDVQKSTLGSISDSIFKSMGPFGSTTGIIKTGQFTEYTKDGHTIMENEHFTGVIEESLCREFTEITRHVAVKVGDGTSSAIVLAKIIFDKLCDLEASLNVPSHMIIKAFKEITDAMKETIKSEARPLSPRDVFDIAMICTNSNADVSSVLSDIYKQHGLDVFIDVGISTTSDNMIKTYDGLTLEVGYSDPAYINTPPKKTDSGKTVDIGMSIIRNAKIYAFQDPIDTREMTAFFKQIVDSNIMEPYQRAYDTKDEAALADVIPTVILAPKISIDISTIFTDIINFLYQFNGANIEAKPPLLIITNMGNEVEDMYFDIMRLCGCPLIKKYIDPQLQQADVDASKAPTLKTVTSFCGEAEVVKADAYKTTFVNPRDMHVINSEGNRVLSDVYESQVNFLQQTLDLAMSQGDDMTTVYLTKRRLQSLKSNMIDYLVGGVTTTDRDSVRALVEDAVKNIRSASKNGVGFGTNYEGLSAINKYIADTSNVEELARYSTLKADIAHVIKEAYLDISKKLYVSTGISEEEALGLIKDSIVDRTGPMNFNTGLFDQSVLCTIDQDIVILDTIAKILTVMFTTNQMLLPTPAFNQYTE